MNIDRVRAILEQAAEQLLDLSKNIGQFGKPLTMRDRQLIRAATLPVIQDLADGMILNHLQGIPIDFDRMASEVNSINID